MLYVEYAGDKPVEVSEWEDVSQYVDEELGLLDEQMREILIRHFFEGQTMKDIAADEGLSQATVSRRVESGVAELRGKLKKRGIIVAALTLAGLLGENAAQAAPALTFAPADYRPHVAKNSRFLPTQHLPHKPRRVIIGTPG